ncbi:hypothetical protein E1295_29245 [Nonomuraea mesophila]|uniref:WXG100 family type VII secretion target n=1 Tax=Nonomuraea mesophila TaxID=2530382 RepID=A0A4R5F2M4_9ACTN|nr:WXG100 family type VII secretion target [Nonomuraea mesophila]TDE41632.1 hypothetical protein E1295_29245 [Nonomuraea mesophila]
MTIPSQSQLFQQAADKELLATNLMRYAEALDEVFASMLARPQTVDTFWKGPAANRFATQAVQLHREISQLRDACTTTADRLRKQAQLARTEAAQMPS